MATSRPAFICNACARSLRLASRQPAVQQATLSTTRSRDADPSLARRVDEQTLPRWSRTPPRMKMPIRLRPMPDQRAWKNNEDQQLLDKTLDTVVGSAAGGRRRGSDLLTDEVKWLSVTHKTFEQGARGFNDRLALMGRRILDVQVSKALLMAPSISPDPAVQLEGETVIGPTTRHPDLEGVENITPLAKHQALLPIRLSALAVNYGLDKVVRWKPRQTDDVARSGRDIVMANTLYAIVGAIAMQKGGEIANLVARERILKPLGLYTNVHRQFGSGDA